MRKNTILAFLLVAVAALSLGGCGGSDTHEQSNVLSGWQGEWKSQSFCLESPEMQPAYEAVAEKMGGAVNADDVHEAMKAMLYSSIASVTVAGDSITFTNAKGESATCEYRYVKDIPMPGFDGHFWKAFEATDAESPYRHVVCTEVHSDTPDSMKHWHFRTGMGMDFDALVNHPNVMWWPTLVAAETTVGVVAQDTTDAAEEMAGFFKMLPPLSKKREGTWKSYDTFLDDPLMDEAYAAIAAKVEGYNASEVKDLFKTMFDARGIVSLKVGKNGDLTLVMDDDSEMKYAYESHLFSPMPYDGFSWYRFEATDVVAASPYRYLIVSLVHQDNPAKNTMLHWHARFGKEGFEPLLDPMSSWYPTFVPEDLKIEQVVQEVKEGADEFAGMFPKK